MMSAVAESEMASGADLRRRALALEGTSEAPHFERAAFKVTRSSEEEIATVTDCTCRRGGAPGSLDGTR
jgi:hypothetical protein